MTRRLDKIEAQLKASEAALVSQLREVLQRVEASGFNIFINSRFDPFDNANHQGGPGEALLQAALSIQESRASLGLSPEEGPAHLFLSACEENANLENHNRLGPRRLAARLLKSFGAA